MPDFKDPMLTAADPFRSFAGGDLDFGPDSLVLQWMQAENARTLADNRRAAAAASPWGRHISTGQQSTNVEDRRPAIVKVPDGRGGYTVTLKSTYVDNSSPKPLTGVLHAAATSQRKANTMPSGYNSTGTDYSPFYNGINLLYSGDNGGIKLHGSAPTAVPPSNVSRVTPEGLNVNKVQTVAVDPFTGTPIVASQRGTEPAHQTYIPGPSGTIATDKSGARLPAGLTDQMAYGSGVPVGDAPAVHAIDTATTLPAQSMGASWAPPWAKGVNPDMRWENAQVGTAPATGDRWGRLRIDGNATEPNRPGLVTGAAPRAGVNPQVQSVMAAQPGQTFLEARGVSTAGLNQSQVANELMKQMASSSRNADGTRGFGV